MIIDPLRRLSKSLLWQLQHAAYAEFGIGAWGQKGVPFYLTSNPHTANLYAKMAVSYLQDCLKRDAQTPIDSSAPLYLFDLGAGSGRFAFLFLKELRHLLELLQLEHLHFCYILTDIIPGNLDFCRQHPQLQEHLAAGRLDFASYNHAQEEPLYLQNAHITLISDKLINPAIVIANYFFDTIPQDLFKVVKGELYEGRIALALPKESEEKHPNSINPAWIEQLECSYDYTPCKSENYYIEPLLNAILEEYRKSFDGCSFLFPVGAFQSIDYFNRLTNSKLLLLAADQGVCSSAQIRTWGEPHIARHASFSMPVSYHALARFFEVNNGEAMLTKESDPFFVVMSAILGGRAESFLNTRYTFMTEWDAFEPSDYWKLSEVASIENATLSIDTLIALLKVGRWDPVNFNSLYPQIKRSLPTLTDLQKTSLANTIERVWEQFYFVTPEEAAFVMNLGVILFDLKKYRKSQLFFQRAESLGGNSSLLMQNRRACEEACRGLIE